MNLTKLKPVIVSALFLIVAPFVAPQALSVVAQRGNSIEGFVFGYERRPMADLYVELNDDLNRTVARTRTSNAGAFTFAGLGSGDYIVRVLTMGTEYEEREERVEFFNLTQNSSDSKQVLFYLKLKRGAAPPIAEAVFGQDVPDDAKRLYEKGVSDLAGKRDAEGLAALRSAIEAFPKYFAALERLGLEYLQIGKPETLQAAGLMFELAVAVNPRAYKSWYGLAFARNALGQFAEGLKASEKSVELRPNAPEAIFLLGRLLRNLKKYPEAEKQLAKARDLFGEAPAQLHWELALIYGNNLKKYGDAAKELKLYLKANPDATNKAAVQKLIADFEAKAGKK